ncbi:MAG: ATP-binding protein [Bacilli bacterium]|nr:ATP-binding protein [Bacilli bacterium]
MNYDRPRYLKILNQSRNDGLIKVLTGIRQCGKSYILVNYFEKLKADYSLDQVLTYKLASRSNKAFRDKDKFEDELRSKITDNSKPYFIYIDEVQMCPGFEEMLLSVREDFPNVDFYITGSNSKMLSKDILEKLGTNGREIKVYPLDLEEFIDFYQRIGRLQENVDILEEYLNVGGMPSAVVNPDNAGGLFDSIKQTILIHDICDRYANVNEDVLKRVLEYICSSYGSPFSLDNAVKQIKNPSITKDVVQQYLGYLEDAFLLYPMKNIKTGLSSLNEEQDEIVKYYVVDHALACRIAGGFFNVGSRVENIVYINLLRNGINEISIGKKSNNQKEIDFTFQKNTERYLLQVTEKMDIESETEKREFDSFKGKKGENKLLITLRPYFGSYGKKYPEVQIVLLKDFLLGYKI